MWDDLERIGWHRLEHNYGMASDVPGWLRDCSGADAERAGTALDELDMAVYHQGFWICSAAPATLPFLVDLAAGRAVHHRPALVDLIAKFINEAERIEPRLVDQAWPGAVEREIPRLVGLLDDADPGVRRATARLLGEAGLPEPDVTAAIWRRWPVEQDQVTRRDLVLTFGALLQRRPDAGDIRALLHGLLDSTDVQTGLAAVHALARTEPDLPLNRVPQLLAATRDPGVAAWTGSAWLGRYVTTATGRLLRHDPNVAAEFAMAIGGESGLHEVAALLARWRTVTPALHGYLIDRLGDRDAEVRFRAAYLLACVPSSRAADALAALVDDDPSVVDAAAWALARLGDDRCLPAMRERLAGPRLGFSPHGDFFTTPPGSWHGFWLPSIDEALIPLVALAGDLVPAVRVGSSPALCRLLGAWGAASAPAVSQLVPLLDHRDFAATAATALGDIGPAAGDAVPDLLRHASTPAAAWAHWRITGDPTLALATLPHATDHQDLRKLGDLGELAAGAAGRLARLSRSKEEWVRAEAAYAHYRVTGDPDVAVSTLTEVTGPLADGTCRPVMITALEHLAAMRPAAVPARLIARAVLDRPHRLSYFGGWHVFAEDERLRGAAATMLS